MTGQLELDCGIAYRRLADWLSLELALPCDADGNWLYSDGAHACSIGLSPLDERSLASVSLERTALKAIGDASALESFRARFTLRFMSAGG